MKIKLFLTSSLLLLGVWLAVAYNHSVDLSSYRNGPATKTIQAVDAENPKEEEADVSLASK